MRDSKHTLETCRIFDGGQRRFSHTTPGLYTIDQPWFVNTYYVILCNTIKGPVCHMWTAKAQTRLRFCAVWSGHLLFIDISSCIQWFCKQTSVYSDLSFRCLFMCSEIKTKISFRPSWCLRHLNNKTGLPLCTDFNYCLLYCVLSCL